MFSIIQLLLEANIHKWPHIEKALNVSLAKFFKNIFQEKFANSIVNLLNSPMSFRECVRITKARGIENIPTYLWFLLQFWPTHWTASKKLHRTGRFRIRRMVQAWLFRKSDRWPSFWWPIMTSANICNFWHLPFAWNSWKGWIDGWKSWWWFAR